MAALIFRLLVHLDIEVPDLGVGEDVGRQTGIGLLRRDHDAILGDDISALGDYLGAVQQVARNQARLSLGRYRRSVGIIPTPACDGS